jgi:hypothetical protein
MVVIIMTVIPKVESKAWSRGPGASWPGTSRSRPSTSRWPRPSSRGSGGSRRTTTGASTRTSSTTQTPAHIPGQGQTLVPGLGAGLVPDLAPGLAPGLVSGGDGQLDVLDVGLEIVMQASTVATPRRPPARRRSRRPRRRVRARARGGTGTFPARSARPLPRAPRGASASTEDAENQVRWLRLPSPASRAAMPQQPRLVRQAFTGEVSWHVLQHNRAYAARHDEDSEELGLAPTYVEFPSAHPAWQGGAAAVERRLRQRLARVRARTISAADNKKWEPNDLEHAIRYLGWEPWSLAEVPLAEFVHTVRSNAWGALRDLTPERVARFVNGYKSDERQGHENILALLDQDGRFEPDRPHPRCGTVGVRGQPPYPRSVRLVPEAPRREPVRPRLLQVRGSPVAQPAVTQGRRRCGSTACS